MMSALAAVVTVMDSYGRPAIIIGDGRNPVVPQSH